MKKEVFVLREDNFWDCRSGIGVAAGCRLAVALMSGKHQRNVWKKTYSECQTFTITGF